MIDLQKYQAFVFDLDGVVWLHDDPIPGAAQTIETIRQLDKPVRFLTNNAGQHRSYYVGKLERAGIPADLDEVVSSGFATAQYIAQQHGPCPVHVMGMPGLEREIEEAGHSLVNEGARFVVCGFDRGFTWEKLNTAFRNIDRDGARFIACNDDPRYPTPEGNQPGTGANIAALAYATGQQPEMVIGKPHQPILDVLLSTLGSPPEACLMTGDKVVQDIGVGQLAGMDTAFVLSGSDCEADIQKHGITPTYVLQSIADFLPK